jgi:hypothetical protein
MLFVALAVLLALWRTGANEPTDAATLILEWQKTRIRIPFKPAQLPPPSGFAPRRPAGRPLP